MHKLIIKLYKPSYISAEIDHQDTPVVQTYTALISNSSLTKGKKNIPVMPKLHAQALLDLSKLGIKSKNYQLLPLATYLGLHLTKESPSIVNIRIEDIQTDLGLSDRSITKTLNELDSLGYIEKSSQSIYIIKPKLAFYGSLINWSIALQGEIEGKSLEDITILQNEVQQQIEENTIEAIKNITNKVVKKPDNLITN